MSLDPRCSYSCACQHITFYPPVIESVLTFPCSNYLSPVCVGHVFGIMVALHVAAPNEPSIFRGFLQVLSKYNTVVFVSCTVKVPG